MVTELCVQEARQCGERAHDTIVSYKPVERRWIVVEASSRSNRTVNGLSRVEQVDQARKDPKELVVRRKDERADIIGRAIDRHAVLKSSEMRRPLVQHDFDVRVFRELSRGDHAGHPSPKHRYARVGHRELMTL